MVPQSLNSRELNRKRPDFQWFSAIFMHPWAAGLPRSPRLRTCSQNHLRSGSLVDAVGFHPRELSSNDGEKSAWSLWCEPVCRRSKTKENRSSYTTKKDKKGTNEALSHFKSTCPWCLDAMDRHRQGVLWWLDDLDGQSLRALVIPCAVEILPRAEARCTGLIWTIQLWWSSTLEICHLVSIWDQPKGSTT